jgi:hypothetical protein
VPVVLLARLFVLFVSELRRHTLPVGNVLLSARKYQASFISPFLSSPVQSREQVSVGKMPCRTRKVSPTEQYPYSILVPNPDFLGNPPHRAWDTAKDLFNEIIIIPKASE